MPELATDLQTVLGPSFTVQHELGGGGMSRVFVAHDNALGRTVVVKVLPPELAATVSVDRFRREIMLAASLQHPNVVPVLSAGELDGLPYLMMPFIEGESLRTRLARGPLSIRETVTVMRDVARALAYAHGRGIIHRDIKPDNVLLSGGAATVTDFGVAKAITAARQPMTSGATTRSGHTITAVGISLGTPAYMSPEQAAADPATDHRADLYALGIVAYEMLVGGPPFQRTTPRALLAAQLSEPPPPLATRRGGVPEPLARLIMRCLEKEPSARPQTANEIARALDDPEMVSGAITAEPLPGFAPRGRWRATLMLGAAVVALGGVAFGAYVRGRSAALPSTAPTAAPTPAENALAVMPFVDVAGATDGYLAAGMTSELADALSRLPGVRVASRAATTAARERFALPAELGRALNVSMLLEGTIQRQGDRLRVTARLVKIGTDSTLWSDMFDGTANDLFTMQDAIASAVTSALGAGRRDSTVAATGRGTDDARAYDAYLRATAWFARRGADGLDAAIDGYRRAVALDPRFARAWLGLAEAYTLLPSYASVRYDSVAPLADAALARAATLDPASPETQAARGSLLVAAWRWDEAERAYRASLAASPGNASAHQWLGELLLANGRFDEALQHLERASRLDSLSAVAAGSLALGYGAAGRDADAVRAGARAVALAPDQAVSHVLAGAAALYVGRLPLALQELTAATALDSASMLSTGLLGYAYARSGQGAVARAMRERAAGEIGRRAGAATSAARISLGLADTSAALDFLERAVRDHDPFLAQESLAAPIYDPIRRSARFAAVVAALHLDRRVIER